MSGKNQKKSKKNKKKTQLLSFDDLDKVDVDNGFCLDSTDHVIKPFLTPDNFREDLQLLENVLLPDSMDTFPIFIMASNVFIRNKYGCIPAEVTVVKFTLANGIVDYLHSFIAPKNIRIVDIPDVKDFSDNYHKIPFENSELATEEDNIETIKKFFEFCHVNKVGNFCSAMIFCGRDEYDQAQETIDWLMKQSKGLNLEWNIRLIKLNTVLYRLSKILDNGLNQADIYDMLNLVLFPYDSLCSYHDPFDNRYCSRGLAFNYAYIIARNFCPLMDIKMIPGQHMPKKI